MLRVRRGNEGWGGGIQGGGGVGGGGEIKVGKGWGGGSVVSLSRIYEAVLEMDMYM